MPHLFRTARRFHPARCAALLGLLLAGTSHAKGLGGTPEQGLMAVAEVRIGVERMAKLHFESLASTTDTPRVRRSLTRERDRVLAALALLREQKVLNDAQRRRVAGLSEGIAEFAERVNAGSASGDVYRDSEALAARITFVSTFLSSQGDADLSTLLDLVTRAAATAQRLSKINYAGAAAGRARAVEVDASQSLIEFRSALEAIDSQQLDEYTRGELGLAQNQWILLRAALSEQGLARDRRRLAELGSISDHIAEALLALARRTTRAAIAR